MKYFTPDLVVAYGSEDPATWKEAEARWDAACESYNAYHASLRAELPPGLRHIEETYAFHDAVIHCMGRRAGVFFISVQLDRPPQPLLTLHYALVEEPSIRPGVLPPDYCSTGNQVEWQYDEIEKVDGQPPTWRQSVLLSNGWEITLHFQDIRVEELQAVLPIPRNGAADVPTAATPQLA